MLGTMAAKLRPKDPARSQSPSADDSRGAEREENADSTNCGSCHTTGITVSD